MIRTLLPLILLVAIAAAGCDTNAGQDEFFLQSRLSPSGITETNASGEVIGDPDTEDWRTAPSFQGSVVVMPARPNPASRNEEILIVVQDTFGDIITGGVNATGINDNNQFVRLDVDEGNGPIYILSINPRQLRIVGGDDARLYRIRVFTNDNRIITYGDIRVQ